MRGKGSIMGFKIARLLIPNRISNKYNNFRGKFSFENASERLKGSRFEKIGNFGINLARDYVDVIKETSNDIKQRPKKALAYAWGFWGWLYCVKTNPDECSFRDQCLMASSELTFLPSTIRNKESSSHLAYLESSFNEGILRRLNLGICSFMWVDNYDKTVGLYASQCKYLEPKYLSFYERIVDFGILGKWWVIRRKMRDYDINADEWNGEKKIYV